MAHQRRNAQTPSRRIEMKWLTAKRQKKLIYAVAALVTTCGAAMAGSDSEQAQRFSDPNQWGASKGYLNLRGYSGVKIKNTRKWKGMQLICSQCAARLRG